MELNTFEYILLSLMLIGSISFSFYTYEMKQKIELQSLEYNSIINHANCGIMHIDRYGIIRKANPVFISFLGDKKTFRTLDDYLSLLDTENSDFFLKTIQGKKELGFEQSFYNSANKEINLNIFLSFLPDEKGIIIIAFSREDKLALQKAIHKTKVFFNHSDLGHIILDHNHTIVEINKTFCDLMEYEQGEVIFKNFSIFFATELLYKTFVKNYLRDNSLDDISNIEYRLKKKNGLIFWVEMFGKHFKTGMETYYVWSIRDISVRVNARNTIRDLNNKIKEELKNLQEILDVIPMPVFIKDKNFNYIGCNASFCDFINLEKSKIIGNNVFNIYDYKLASYFQEEDEKMYDNAYQISQVTIEGEEKTIEVHKKSLYTDGVFNGFVGILIDMTEKELEKKHLEERVKEELEKNKLALEQHQKEQIRSAKFSSIGKMAAGITHEINTPLTYVKGNFEMLCEDIQKIRDEELKKTMFQDSQVIKEGLERIANIIESMREISQKSSEKREFCNIYETLISSLILSHNRAKQISHIYINGNLFTLLMQKNEIMCSTFVQKQRIEQLWIIIISNALDELIKKENFDTRRLDITLTCNKKFAFVKFKDNAGGIKEEIIQKIFEPFESTKESSGIGIGLNIAKQIVAQHNGEIKAYNKDGGAVFEIHIPLKEEEFDE